MNILHICQVDLVRFVGDEGYYEKFQRALPNCTNYFYIMNDGLKAELEKNTTKVCYKSSDNQNIKLDDWVLLADYIVLHSIHSEDINHLKKLIDYATKNSKKLIWLIWGHDLYDAYKGARYLKGLRIGYVRLFIESIISEHYRKKLIKNLYSIVAAKCDLCMVQKWYKTSARMIDYDFIGYGTKQPIESVVSENHVKRIFVGNHLDPHCRYEDSFRRISKIDDGKLEVYCVARGYTEDNKKAKSTIEVGRKLFGNRLHLITEFTQYNEYCQLLSQLDVAVLNIDRQMAQGTAFIFLYYGKKVFFSNENGLYDEFLNMGIKVYHLDEMTSEELNKTFSEQEKKQHKQLLIQRLSDERFAKFWKKVFE